MLQNFRYEPGPILGKFLAMTDGEKRARGRPVKAPEDPEASPVTQMRARLGLSQRELAKRVGVHVNTIGRIERGERKGVKLEVFEKIAEALDCPLWAVIPRIFSEDQRQILEAFEKAKPELRVLMTNIVDAVKKDS